MGRTHELKTWPSFFEQVWRGRKRFELRKNDRDFAVGDTLILCEFEPSTALFPNGEYTGRRLTGVVSYIMHGGRFGLAPDLCVLSLDAIRPLFDEKPEVDRG